MVFPPTQKPIALGDILAEMPIIDKLEGTGANVAVTLKPAA